MGDVLGRQRAGRPVSPPCRHRVRAVRDVPAPAGAGDVAAVTASSLPPTLTADQVTAAVARLVGLWPNQVLSDEVRRVWHRLLPTLHQGEFTPALDAWVAGERGKWRPLPGEFFALVQGRRAEHEASTAVERTERRLAELRAVPADKAQALVQLERCRAILRGGGGA